MAAVGGQESAKMRVGRVGTNRTPDAVRLGPGMVDQDERVERLTSGPRYAG